MAVQMHASLMLFLEYFYVACRLVFIEAGISELRDAVISHC